MKTDRKARLLRMVLCALCASVICVFSPISVPIGPVPISLGLFAVLVAGVILPPSDSLLAVSLFAALGAVGLPVFSGARGGFSVLAGPTGGYIWGFILTAPVTGLIIRLLGNRASKPLAVTALYTASALCGTLVCYAAGTLQFCLVTGTEPIKALSLCVFPFIPVDMLKALCASILGATVRPLIKTELKQFQ